MPGLQAGRANNFNLLRLIAAGAVIVSHAFGLRHPPGFYDENVLLSSQGIGWAAVNVFFVMSGYLIAKAAVRDPDPLRFLRNRALRIYPGLIVCIAVCVVALGLVYRRGDLLHYLGQGETIRFLLGNVSAVIPQYRLPGVFEANPYPDAVNGSLWSLRFEIACYVAVAVLMAAGVLRRPRVRAAAFAGLLAVYVGGAVLKTLGGFPASTTLTDLHRLTICFGLGMAYAYVEGVFRVRLWQVMVSGTAFAVSFAMPWPALQAAAATVTLASAVFWFAFLQRPILAGFRNTPDWSYGVYIYAFPIQQLLMAFWPGLHPVIHCLLAFALVLIPASLSWRFIEKPALALKRTRVGGRGPVLRRSSPAPRDVW